jgi:hypothetical protein
MKKIVPRLLPLLYTLVEERVGERRFPTLAHGPSRPGQTVKDVAAGGGRDGHLVHNGILLIACARVTPLNPRVICRGYPVSFMYISPLAVICLRVSV